MPGLGAWEAWEGCPSLLLLGLQGLTSESLQLPRISSGFIPNSVVAQQLHTLDLPETERLVRVIGPQVISAFGGGWDPFGRGTQ